MFEQEQYKTMSRSSSLSPTGHFLAQVISEACRIVLIVTTPLPNPMTLRIDRTSTVFGPSRCSPWWGSMRFQNGLKVALLELIFFLSFLVFCSAGSFLWGWDRYC